MITINIDIDEITARFFADRYRIHQSTGGKLTYSQYVGQFVDNLIDEVMDN